MIVTRIISGARILEPIWAKRDTGRSDPSGCSGGIKTQKISKR